MTETTTETTHAGGVSRRTMLKLAAAGGAGAALVAAQGIGRPFLEDKGWLSADGPFDATATALADSLFYLENFPTSPLILKPFSDDLVIPQAMRPIPSSEFSGWLQPPDPMQQNSVKDCEQHQIWPTAVGYGQPNVYRIRVQVSTHSFTTSNVLPIDASGKPTSWFDSSGKQQPAPNPSVGVPLPASTIYGFNGTFPGPRINAEYGRSNLVRFINELDQNPQNLDRGDFGAPDWSFLTHLHNGHTAPESDGNPNYTMNKSGIRAHGYLPGQWVDNLYLNYPAGGDDCEKQTFFWFHDHRMDHTGSNVYKGMVGLYPIYDPKVYPGYNGRFDAGQETEGLRLPGVRTDYGDGSFDVDYDIPLAFYDCRLDDGVTTHQDIHDGLGEFPNAKNPRTHPEWWGKTFFKHMPNHGFVGDIFTVNGTAYPVMKVKRRRYRFRFLDASIARIYEFKLMSSSAGPKAAKDLGYQGTELQGQYRIPDGQQCMQFVEIADDGGLLPYPIRRDSFELWPAKRREMIIDFRYYQDGVSATKDGDAIYLTNIMKMPDGRMWSNSSRFSLDKNYQVPVLKFVIDGNTAAQDDSVMPVPLGTKDKAGNLIPATKLRDLPQFPKGVTLSTLQAALADRKIFEVQRGSAGGEMEWMINGKPFDPTTVETSLQNPNGKTPLAQQPMGSWALWEIRNGGGGWVHPFHLHMEEHQVYSRNGKVVISPDFGKTSAADAGHPDDDSREDLINLDPSESVVIFRQFRSFKGKYVAHCHNLAHEDHAMMFGWEIT